MTTGRLATTLTRRLAPLLAGGLLLVLNACGSERDTSATAPATADLEVRAIDGLAWDAKSYTATAGSVTIYSENDSVLPHNLHVLDSAGTDMGAKIDLPTPGSSGTIDLDLIAGEYRIVCKIAGHDSMVSTLTVS